MPFSLERNSKPFNDLRAELAKRKVDFSDVPELKLGSGQFSYTTNALAINQTVDNENRTSYIFTDYRGGYHAVSDRNLNNIRPVMAQAFLEGNSVHITSPLDRIINAIQNPTDVNHSGKTTALTTILQRQGSDSIPLSKFLHQGNLANIFTEGYQLSGAKNTHQQIVDILNQTENKSNPLMRFNGVGIAAPQSAYNTLMTGGSFTQEDKTYYGSIIRKVKDLGRFKGDVGGFVSRSGQMPEADVEPFFGYNQSVPNMSVPVRGKFQLYSNIPEGQAWSKNLFAYRQSSPLVTLPKGTTYDPQQGVILHNGQPLTSGSYFGRALGDTTAGQNRLGSTRDYRQMFNQSLGNVRTAVLTDVNPEFDQNGAFTGRARLGIERITDSLSIKQGALKLNLARTNQDIGADFLASLPERSALPGLALQALQGEMRGPDEFRNWLLGVAQRRNLGTPQTISSNTPITLDQYMENAVGSTYPQGNYRYEQYEAQVGSSARSLRQGYMAADVAGTLPMQSRTVSGADAWVNQNYTNNQLSASALPIVTEEAISRIMDRGEYAQYQNYDLTPTQYASQRGKTFEANLNDPYRAAQIGATQIEGNRYNVPVFHDTDKNVTQLENGNYRISNYNTLEFPMTVGVNPRPEFTSDTMKAGPYQMGLFSQYQQPLFNALTNIGKARLGRNRAYGIVSAYRANYSPEQYSRLSETLGIAQVEPHQVRGIQQGLISENPNISGGDLLQGTMQGLKGLYGSQALQFNAPQGSMVAPSASALLASMTKGDNGDIIPSFASHMSNAIIQSALGGDPGELAQLTDKAMTSFGKYANQKGVLRQAQSIFFPMTGGIAYGHSSVAVNEMIASRSHIAKSLGITNVQQLYQMQDKGQLAAALLRNPFTNPQESTVNLNTRFWEDLSPEDQKRIPNPRSNVWINPDAMAQIYGDFDVDRITALPSHVMGSNGLPAGGMLNVSSPQEIIQRATNKPESEILKQFEEANERNGFSTRGTQEHFQNPANLFGVHSDQLSSKFAKDQASKSKVGLVHNAMLRHTLAANLAGEDIWGTEHPLMDIQRHSLAKMSEYGQQKLIDMSTPDENLQWLTDVNSFGWRSPQGSFGISRPGERLQSLAGNSEGFFQSVFEHAIGIGGQLDDEEYNRIGLPETIAGQIINRGEMTDLYNRGGTGAVHSRIQQVGKLISQRRKSGSNSMSSEMIRSLTGASSFSEWGRGTQDGSISDLSALAQTTTGRIAAKYSLHKDNGVARGTFPPSYQWSNAGQYALTAGEFTDVEKGRGIEVVAGAGGAPKLQKNWLNYLFPSSSGSEAEFQQRMDSARYMLGSGQSENPADSYYDLIEQRRKMRESGIAEGHPDLKALDSRIDDAQIAMQMAPSTNTGTFIPHGSSSGGVGTFIPLSGNVPSQSSPEWEGDVQPIHGVENMGGGFPPPPELPAGSFASSEEPSRSSRSINNPNPVGQTITNNISKDFRPNLDPKTLGVIAEAMDHIGEAAKNLVSPLKAVREEYVAQFTAIDKGVKYSQSADRYAAARGSTAADFFQSDATFQEFQKRFGDKLGVMQDFLKSNVGAVGDASQMNFREAWDAKQARASGGKTARLSSGKTKVSTKEGEEGENQSRGIIPRGNFSINGNGSGGRVGGVDNGVEEGDFEEYQWGEFEEVPNPPSLLSRLGKAASNIADRAIRGQGLFHAKMAYNVLASPAISAAKDWMQQESTQGMSMLQSGQINYNDLMQGTYGMVQRREIASQEGRLSFGQQVYQAYSPLVNFAIGPQSSGSILGAAAAIGAPAAGIGIATTSLTGNPLAGLVAAGVTAGIGTLGYGASNAQNYSAVGAFQQQRASGNGIQAILSNPEGAAGAFWNDLLNGVSGITGQPLVSDADRQRYQNSPTYVSLMNQYAKGGIGKTQALSQAQSMGFSAGDFMSGSLDTYLTGQTAQGVDRDTALSNYSYWSAYSDQMPSGLMSNYMTQIGKSGVDFGSMASTYSQIMNVSPANAQGSQKIQAQIANDMINVPNKMLFAAAQQQAVSMGIPQGNLALSMAGMGNAQLNPSDINNYLSAQGGVEALTARNNSNLTVAQARTNNKTYFDNGGYSLFNAAGDYDNHQDYITGSRLRSQALEAGNYYSSFRNVGASVQQATSLANSVGGIQDQDQYNLITSALSGNQMSLSIRGQQTNNPMLQTLNTDTGMSKFFQNVPQASIDLVKSHDPYGMFRLSDQQAQIGTQGYQYMATMDQRQMQNAGWTASNQQRDIGYQMQYGSLNTAQQLMAQGNSYTGFQGTQLNTGNGMNYYQIQQAQWGITRQQQAFGLQQEGQQLGIAQQQFNLTGQQFNTNYGLQVAQFQYQTGFQRQQMQIDQSHTVQQEQWGTQDIAYNRSQLDVQFGWQMQDYDRNIRYARGMDKRNLMRDQQRAVIEYSMQASHSDVESQRNTTQIQWEEQDFDRKKQYFEQNTQFQQQSLDNQKKFFDMGQELDKQRLDMQKQAHDKNVQWMQQEWSLEDQQRSLDKQFAQWQYQNQLDLDTKTQQLTKDVQLWSDAADQVNQVVDVMIAKAQTLQGIAGIVSGSNGSGGGTSSSGGGSSGGSIGISASFAGGHSIAPSISGQGPGRKNVIYDPGITHNGSSPAQVAVVSAAADSEGSKKQDRMIQLLQKISDNPSMFQVVMDGQNSKAQPIYRQSKARL